MAKILLDAGHYGKYNRSPQVPEYYESERVWVLMRLLQMHLEKKGHEVRSTRDVQAIDLAVLERGKKAKGYDLFISLHSNDFDGSDNTETANKIDYVVAYVPSYAKNDRCTKSKELGLKLAEYVKAVIGSQQSARTDTKLKDNGDEWYGVLRGWQNTDCPVGFILEHGFHSNPKTAKFLLDDINLFNLTKGEADIIDNYLRGKITETAETASTSPTEQEVIKVGSVVKIKDGAKLYNSTTKLQSWVYPLTWVVLQIKGDRVVVDKSADGKHSIESPININDLILIK